MTDGQSPFTAHPTACIDPPVSIGDGTRIWHYTHVVGGAKIGAACVLGQNVFVAGTALIGDNVKIQNNVSIYDGVVLENEVFCGPSAVFTNVINPRAAISRRSAHLITRVCRGATIGANATIVCGATIGRHAFVAAGTVVTRQNVPDYALLAGVPARRRGWVGRHGSKLLAPDSDGTMRCPESQLRYREVAPGIVRCLDLDEDAPLPENLSVTAR